MVSKFKIHQPRRGEKVWVEGEKQPNGTIIAVDRFDGDIQQVTVKFHETKQIKDIPWDDLDGNWSDSFGGTWMIHKLG